VAVVEGLHLDFVSCAPGGCGAGAGGRC
jgi:hypothetical protein